MLPHKVIVKAQLGFFFLYEVSVKMLLKSCREHASLPVWRAVQCWRAVPHRLFCSHAGTGSLQQAGKNNVAGLCSFPTVTSWWFFVTWEFLSMCLIALMAFPFFFFFFFFPSKLISFTMLNISEFHNLICRKNQLILWFSKPAAQQLQVMPSAS